MPDQSTVFQYFFISYILLWVIVAALAVMKVRELIKKRRRIRAMVLDDVGEVRDSVELGRQKEILIGKSTPSNLVHIDFSDSMYAGSIEEEHAAFQREGSFWYVRSRASNGMVGLKMKGGDTVYKLRRDVPYRIRCGDMVYISYEKILIQ